MKMIKIKPAEGRVLRNHAHGNRRIEGETMVAKDLVWVKRINDGDAIVISDKPKSAEKEAMKFTPKPKDTK